MMMWGGLVPHLAERDEASGGFAMWYITQKICQWVAESGA